MVFHTTPALVSLTGRDGDTLGISIGAAAEILMKLRRLISIPVHAAARPPAAFYA
jgi:hypothetical protein